MTLKKVVAVSEVLSQKSIFSKAKDVFRSFLNQIKTFLGNTKTKNDRLNALGEIKTQVSDVLAWCEQVTNDQNPASDMEPDLLSDARQVVHQGNEALKQIRQDLAPRATVANRSVREYWLPEFAKEQVRLDTLTDSILPDFSQVQEYQTDFRAKLVDTPMPRVLDFLTHCSSIQGDFHGQMNHALLLSAGAKEMHDDIAPYYRTERWLYPRDAMRCLPQWTTEIDAAYQRVRAFLQSSYPQLSHLAQVQYVEFANELIRHLLNANHHIGALLALNIGTLNQLKQEKSFYAEQLKNYETEQHSPLTDKLFALKIELKSLADAGYMLEVSYSTPLRPKQLANMSDPLEQRKALLRNRAIRQERLAFNPDLPGSDGVSHRTAKRQLFDDEPMLAASVDDDNDRLSFV